MRFFKYIILFIHIIAVIMAMAFNLTTDHIILGQGFGKCVQSGNYTYITENASNFSVLYKGDYFGTVSDIYKSNQEENNVTIVDFSIDDDVYVLQKKSLGYNIRKLTVNGLNGISRTKDFSLNDIEKITDFYVSTSNDSAYITAIANGSMSVNVYSIGLSSFIFDSEANNETSDEMPESLPIQFRYESVTGTLDTAYFDGANIIPDSYRPTENIRDAYSYSRGLDLSFIQSFIINSFVFVIYIAYAIAGILLIIIIYNLIEKRRRFIDLILLNEILILAGMVAAIIMFSNIVIPVIWAVAMSIANIVVILFENRDLMIICEDIKQISNGTMKLQKPWGGSIETKTLWRGINEIRYLYEQYKYIQDTNAAAAIRFLPHNISSMFKSDSLDEIKPGDSAFMPGYFMTLRTRNDVSNEMVALVEQYEKSADGTLLTGECSPSELKLLLSKASGNEVGLGLRLFSDMMDESVCAVYFKDDFKISVVGTSTKSILNVSSPKMPTMEKLASWFFEMGIKMVITEEVKNNSNIESPTRLIGYCEFEGEKINFYEVLNAYSENIRSIRLKCIDNFNNALSFMYQDNYYLARTAFSDILKVDSKDELARWYLFICEKYLNNPDVTDRSCALNPRN